MKKIFIFALILLFYSDYVFADSVLYSYEKVFVYGAEQWVLMPIIVSENLGSYDHKARSEKIFEILRQRKLTSYGNSRLNNGRVEIAEDRSVYRSIILSELGESFKVQKIDGVSFYLGKEKLQPEREFGAFLGVVPYWQALSGHMSGAFVSFEGEILSAEHFSRIDKKRIDAAILRALSKGSDVEVLGLIGVLKARGSAGEEGLIGILKSKRALFVRLAAAEVLKDGGSKSIEGEVLSFIRNKEGLDLSLLEVFSKSQHSAIAFEALLASLHHEKSFKGSLKSLEAMKVDKNGLKRIASQLSEVDVEKGSQIARFIVSKGGEDVLFQMLEGGNFKAEKLKSSIASMLAAEKSGSVVSGEKSDTRISSGDKQRLGYILAEGSFSEVIGILEVLKEESSVVISRGLLNQDARVRQLSLNLIGEKASEIELSFLSKVSNKISEDSLRYEILASESLIGQSIESRLKIVQGKEEDFKRRSALLSLAGEKNEKVKKLLDTLISDKILGDVALIAMVGRDDESYVKLVRDALFSENVQMRRSAVEIMARSSSSVFESLRAQAFKDNSGSVVSHALWSFSRHERREMAKAMIDALKRKNHLLKQLSLMNLSRFIDAKNAQLVLGYISGELFDENHEVKISALLGLGFIVRDSQEAEVKDHALKSIALFEQDPNAQVAATARYVRGL